MEYRDAQKSEFHDTTDDASTSPVALNAQPAVSTAPSDLKPSNRSTSGDADLSPSAHIVRDDTDNGGPLVIETDQPIV